MAIKRITTNLIEDGSIGTIDIANNAIVAAKITDGNITTAKLADLNVTAGKLAGTLDLTGKTITVATATTGDSDTSPASTAFVQQEIAALVDSSPDSLNTLNELAAALGDDASFSTTVTNSIATKLPLAGGTMTGNLVVNAIVDADNFKIDGAQGTDGQLLTSTGSGVAWEDAPASGPTFKTFGTSSIMIGDDSTGTINAADYNTGLGVNVFANLTTGDKNTAVGYYTMGGRSSGSMTGGDNTAIGYEAMPRVTSGQHNTSVGAFSGEYLSTGQGNTYIGYYAGYQNFTGSFNSVMGRAAFFYGDGSHNVAIGRRTLQNNGTKNYNTALGNYALSMVTTGGHNTGLGYEAGRQITTGSKNVIIGSYDGNENSLDIRTSSNNIVLSDGDANIRMYINSSGNVGIGTTNPSTITEISGAVPTLTISDNQSKAWAFGADIARISFFSQDPSGIGGHETGFILNENESDGGSSLSGALVFGTAAYNAAATEAMRIDLAGNVGIGTNNPTATLQTQSTVPDTNIRVGYDANKTTRIGTTSGGDAQIYAYETGVGYHNILLAVDSSSAAGKVGIGTNNPGTPLHVYSNTSGVIATISGPNDYNSETGISLAVDRAKISGVLNGSGGSPGASLRFYTQPDSGSLTERMRIDSSGNVSMGQSFTSGANLHVEDTSDSMLLIYETGTSPYTATLKLASQSMANYGSNVQYTSAAEQLTIENYGRALSASSTSGGIRFRTKVGNSSMSEVMIINGHEGTITQPHQTFFMTNRAAGNQTFANVAWVDVDWTGEPYDTGGNYTLSSGVFTAPIAGVYLFTGLIGLNTITASNYLLVRMECSAAGSFYLNHLQRFNTSSGSAADYGYDTAISQMVYLAVNETVKIQVFAGSGGDHSLMDRSNWQGRLLG